MLHFLTQILKEWWPHRQTSSCKFSVSRYDRYLSVWLDVRVYASWIVYNRHILTELYLFEGFYYSNTIENNINLTCLYHQDEADRIDACDWIREKILTRIPNDVIKSRELKKWTIRIFVYGDWPGLRIAERVEFVETVVENNSKKIPHILLIMTCS